MPQVGFEPTIPVFERAKTVHALDRAATVIGKLQRFISQLLTTLERRYTWNSYLHMSFHFSPSAEWRELMPQIPSVRIVSLWAKTPTRDASEYEAQVPTIHPRLSIIRTFNPLNLRWSRESSVGIAISLRTTQPRNRISILEKGNWFSLFHNDQTGTGTHAGPYPIST
jgi:hypothetical protein